jgi:hypothetical protein
MIKTNSQARLAVNSVTLGDYDRPLQISTFIKDLFAGFQLLNLKNDILRKRSDGIKYSVRFRPSSSFFPFLCEERSLTEVGAGQKGRGCGVRSLPAEFASKARSGGVSRGVI